MKAHNLRIPKLSLLVRVISLQRQESVFFGTPCTCIGFPWRQLKFINIKLPEHFSQLFHQTHLPFPFGLPFLCPVSFSSTFLTITLASSSPTSRTMTSTSSWSSTAWASPSSYSAPCSSSPLKMTSGSGSRRRLRELSCVKSKKIGRQSCH